MAEMTVREAIAILNGKVTQPIESDFDEYGELRELILYESEYRQIAALLEQQAAEIAKKGRMLRRATTELDNAHYCAIGGGMPDNMQHCDNSGGNYSCADCWLAWLEKEAQGVE